MGLVGGYSVLYYLLHLKEKVAFVHFMPIVALTIIQVSVACLIKKNIFKDQVVMRMATESLKKEFMEIMQHLTDGLMITRAPENSYSQKVNIRFKNN